MTALELSRNFFWNSALPDLRRKFPEAAETAAAGLAGNGSECFGYDDALSRDHDWGVDFFLWVPERLSAEIPALREWREKIMEQIPPEYRKRRSAYGSQVGVMTAADFFRSLIGCPGRPDTLQAWLRAPEEQLCMCVNGALFLEGDGSFSRLQTEIRDYYPEDIRRKRLSAACMRAAQAGQYNAPRMAQRGDSVTVQTALTRFTEYVIRIVFLLNRVYRPYYKWAYRRMCELPILGAELGEQLRGLTFVSGFEPDSMAERAAYIENICAQLIGELRRQGLTEETDNFLAVHGEAIRSRIENETLRGLPAQYDPFPD